MRKIAGELSVSSKLSLSKNEIHISPFIHIEKILKFLRLDFTNLKGWQLKFNIFLNFLFMLLAIYYLGFMAKLMFFKSTFFILDMSMQLLSMTWSFEAIISSIFLFRWQFSGQLEDLKEHLEKCQNFEGSKVMANNFKKAARIFLILYIFIIIFNVSYFLKFYFETTHSIWGASISSMFYFRQLRFITSIIVTFMYGVWLTTIYVFVTFTNVAYFEIKFFNQTLKELDGASIDIKSELLEKIDTFCKLSKVISKLDTVFQLYTFTMLATVIPILIFTLMMLNQNLSSFTNLLTCLPFIIFCICSFCSITIAPARIHDEIQNVKTEIYQNVSLWIPYNSEIYHLATVLTSHCDQKGLGISIWGFATLSRPLILATLSATAMMMSLLSEFAPAKNVD